jgi:hypothetical protein
VRTVTGDQSQSAYGHPEAAHRETGRVAQDSLQKLGINDVSDLADPDGSTRCIKRFHTLESVRDGAANYSPAANALTLLNGGIGLGGQGGINLLLSGL